jgi:hypothetical protein
MKLVARAVAVALILMSVATLSLRAQQAADVEKVRKQLIGSYKLVWYVSFDQTGKETKLPYSVGQISYDAAGRMSAQLMRDDQQKFTTSPPSEAERAAAYSRYISYFGRYEIDPAKGVVYHHVEGSLSGNMLGQAMPRYFEFSPDGQSLFLSVRSGDRVTGRLRWDRHRLSSN